MNLVFKELEGGWWQEQKPKTEERCIWRKQGDSSWLVQPDCQLLPGIYLKTGSHFSLPLEAERPLGER